jgi:hypothetical protein
LRGGDAVILTACLYVIAAWFSIVALAIGIAAANRPGVRQKAFLMVLAAASAGVAAVQVLAAAKKG